MESGRRGAQGGNCAEYIARENGSNGGERTKVYLSLSFASEFSLGIKISIRYYFTLYSSSQSLRLRRSSYMESYIILL